MSGCPIFLAVGSGSKSPCKLNTVETSNENNDEFRIFRLEGFEGLLQGIDQASIAPTHSVCSPDQALWHSRIVMVVNLTLEKVNNRAASFQELGPLLGRRALHLTRSWFCRE
jgi:hypothetical protein